MQLYRTGLFYTHNKKQERYSPDTPMYIGNHTPMYMFIHICVPEKGRAQALHVMCEREYGTQYKLQVNSSYYE